MSLPCHDLADAEGFRPSQGLPGQGFFLDETPPPFPLLPFEPFTLANPLGSTQSIGFGA